MSDLPPTAAAHSPKPVPPPSEGVPHTQVHEWARRTLEQLQDVVVALLMATLLLLSLQSIVRIFRWSFFQDMATSTILSEIIFVLILTEVYRLLIFYLREHRISVALAVEVALVSTLREVILHRVHEFEPVRLIALSLLLLVLGGLLAAERWGGRWRTEGGDASAE
jgi:uncharacterized membrane protein (DUF373 family)